MTTESESDELGEFEVPGYRNCLFSGGQLDGHRRLIRLPVPPGTTYNRCVPVDETWQWDVDAQLFRLMEPQP